MEVKDTILKDEASHHELSGLHPARESLESAVVAESVRETGQSLHETPSSCTPSEMQQFHFHLAPRIHMNRAPVTLRGFTQIAFAR
jgi:hypothetical protein